MRLHNARQRAAYYEANANTPDARLFEQLYTSYADRGVMDYVHDILCLLCEEKRLTEAEVKPISELIRRASVASE